MEEDEIVKTKPSDRDGAKVCYGFGSEMIVKPVLLL